MLHMVVRTEINESLFLSQSRAESVLDAHLRVDWLAGSLGLKERAERENKKLSRKKQLPRFCSRLTLCLWPTKLSQFIIFLLDL